MDDYKILIAIIYKEIFLQNMCALKYALTICNQQMKSGYRKVARLGY